ncbi:MAG: hypothetical protein AAGK14_03410 [Verrucomicrobiota bacterium]
MESNRSAWFGLYLLVGLMFVGLFAVGRLFQDPETVQTLRAFLSPDENAAPRETFPMPEDSAAIPPGTAHVVRRDVPAAASRAAGPTSEAVFQRVAARWNRAFGHRILGSRELWQESGNRVAERLRLDLDTRTRHLAVYSAELRLPKLLGAEPTQITLYTDGRNRPLELLLTFANRGSIPPQEFDRRIARDDLDVGRSLGGLLGFAPKEERVAPGGLAKTFQEWKQDGMRVRYFPKINDYVAVSITPASAPPRPRPPGPDFWPRQVQRNAMGDALIRDIPLVRQGYKPYCVPVTIERVLHYLHTPENMFALAAAGDVGYHGCNTFTIYRIMQLRIAAQGLDMEFRPEKLRSVDQVRGSIDQGLPVLWLVSGYVDTFLNALARTEQRSGAVNDRTWRLDLLGANRRRPRIARGQHHSVLIAGYNDQTRELAVIDEMGLLWITEEEAERISQKAVMPIVRR